MRMQYTYRYMCTRTRLVTYTTHFFFQIRRAPRAGHLYIYIYPKKWTIDQIPQITIINIAFQLGFSLICAPRERPWQVAWRLGRNLITQTLNYLNSTNFGFTPGYSSRVLCYVEAQLNDK